MSEVGSGMNIGSDYSGTEKTEKTDKATLRHHILSRRKRVQRKNAERPVNCWCDGSQHT